MHRRRFSSLLEKYRTYSAFDIRSDPMDGVARLLVFGISHDLYFISRVHPWFKCQVYMHNIQH